MDKKDKKKIRKYLLSGNKEYLEGSIFLYEICQILKNETNFYKWAFS
jgi:hypothetical protein